MANHVTVIFMLFMKSLALVVYKVKIDIAV